MTHRTIISFPSTETTGALMNLMLKNMLMPSISTTSSRDSIPSSSSLNGMAAMSSGSTGSSVTSTSDQRLVGWLVGWLLLTLNYLYLFSLKPIQ